MVHGMSGDQTKIVTALIGAEKDGLSSGDLAKRLDISSGRLYPALYALEREGAIKGAWVDGPYPRRRLYHVIRDGCPL